MSISASAVKELREQTGAGIMDCKKALAENNGDVEKSITFLREKGLAAAQKKAGRVAADGLVLSYIHGGGKVGVLVEVNCETDFVAKTEAFQKFAHNVAIHIAMASPKYVDVADVPAADLDAAKARMREEAIAEGKPEHVADKIVEGKLDKFYQEVCLLRQPFIKDEEKSIGAMLKGAIVAIGENIVIRRFTRYQLGE